jgi:hypothetical protein
MDTESDQNSAVRVDGPVPSCARTDAKPLNRDLQMRYDIAKNEEGPLRRTINTKVKMDPSPTPAPTNIKVEPSDEDRMTPEKYPGLDERVRNIETHLAVRYGAYASCVLRLYGESFSMYSAITTTKPCFEAQVFGRPHYPVGEGVSTMGSASLPPTQSRRKTSYALM